MNHTGKAIKKRSSAKEIDKLTGREGWNDLTAVKDNDVYLADADLITCPSKHLVDGIELLASVFHPELFQLPKDFKNKCVQLTKAKVIHGH